MLVLANYTQTLVVSSMISTKSVSMLLGLQEIPFSSGIGKSDGKTPN